MQPLTRRRRLRQLGVTIGSYPPGPYNAITDVAGVLVGHTTLVRGEGEHIPRHGPVRTGVTAILPNGGNIFHERVLGGGFVLNGAGELSGLTQVVEWGLIETPIVLTNTLSVGTCSEAVVDYMTTKNAGIGREFDVVIPLVGECDDSWLNDIVGRHVQAEHVVAAIERAATGPVAEGNVGGGTGMITCDLAGGIGTASRRVSQGGRDFIVGVLVMSNFGLLHQLRVDGLPFGRTLAREWDDYLKRRENYGSIIAVVATDTPLSQGQLNRLAKRAALGIGRCGSTANHGSGEIVLSFSTGNHVPRRPIGLTYQLEVLSDSHINPIYEAAVDATEEAILNAICMANPVIGRDGNTARALPLDRLQSWLAPYHADQPRRAQASVIPARVDPER